MTNNGTIQPLRIFLSYGHDEYAVFAKQLKIDLEKRGHQVWFDTDRLQTGIDWEIHIEEGIDWISSSEHQGRFILLMTPHSVRRPDGYCLNEIARAVSRNLSVIPVMLAYCEPPLSICRIQWMDMQDCAPVTEYPEQYKKKLSRLIKALEENECNFDTQQERLLQILSPLEFSVDIAKHVPRFVGRQWVFDDLDRWLSDPKATRIFWITGAPGTGKTAIAAYLCHTRREAVAYHFCKFGHDDKSDPRRCIMSIAYQLSSQIPDYQERLSTMDLGAEIQKSIATMFDNLIAQPLAMCVSRPDHTLLIVIDALDEATHQQRNELAEFFAARFEDTPPWLKLVITSRPTREVSVPLQGLSPYHLDTERPENLQDIRDFLVKQLDFGAGSPNTSENAAREIQTKSEGSFLYAERVLSDLKEGRLQIDEINTFPQGLGGVFQQFFTRQFSDLDSYQINQRPLIEMIIAARAPLPVSIITEIFKYDEYTLRRELDALGSLFPNNEDCVQPFHQSITDWITDVKRAGPFYVNLVNGHTLIADYCWNEIQQNNHNISEYCLMHLPTHLVELDRWESLLSMVTSPRWKLISRWIQEGYDRGITYLVDLTRYLEHRDNFALQRAGISTQIARMYSLRGEYDSAQKWLEIALNSTSWWRGRRIKSVALHELASLQLYQGNFQHASNLYRQALRQCLWGVPVYRDEAAANLIGLASIARAETRFTEAIRLAKRAIYQSKHTGDFRHEVAGKRLIGAVYNTQGNYTKAQSYLENAIAQCEQHNEHLEKARLLLVLGSMHYRSATISAELSPDAKACFELARAEAEHVNDFYCVSEAKLSLGLYALAEGNKKEAENWLAPLAGILPSDRHTELKASAELGLAALTHLNGDLTTARQRYQEVLEKWDNPSDTFRLQLSCRVLVGLGATHWHLGEQSQAEKAWQQAMQNASRISEGELLLTEARIGLCKDDPTHTPR